MVILIYVRKIMVLAPKILDVNLYLLGTIVNRVKLDTTKLGVYVNHVVVISMEDKVFDVTLMGNVVVILDILETNVIPVKQDSMTEMEVIWMKKQLALNACVTLRVP